MHTIMNAEAAKSRLSNFKDKPFRLHQREVIDWVMGSEKRVKVVKAKTGAGKSLISMVCGVMAGDLTYLVQSKFLQVQITNDFPEIVSVFGRANYPCLADQEKNRGQCLATKTNPCDMKSKCLYYIAKEKAIEASYRVFNFSYYIAETSYAGRFSGNPFTVIDEADSLESVLSGSVSLSFGERTLFQLGLEGGPKRKTAGSKDGLSSWREFGQEALQRSTGIATKLEKEIESMGDYDEEQKLRKMKELEHFTHIIERCNIFLNNMNDQWLYEEVPRSGSRQGQIIFRPTWLSPELSEKYLFRHSDSFTLLSATFPPMPILAKQLGLDIDDIDYYELPSTFDPALSPVHIWPVANVVSKEMDEAVPKLISAIKKILAMHEGQRGILHTVSWKLCGQIIAGVGSPRLVTHTSENRQEVINEFTKGEDGRYAVDSCLCSPSCERGVDLKEDLARFVIIIKNPYLYVGDKLVSARIYSGPLGRLWYQSDALSTVEQMSGRATRSETDTATTYILDYQVEKLYCEKPSLFSQSFRDQITWESCPWGDLLYKPEKMK